MNTKYLFTAIAVVVVVVIGLFLFNQNNKNKVADQTNTTSNANTETSDNSNANTLDQNTNADNVNQNQNATKPQENTNPDGNDVAVFEVNYDGTAFSPSKLTIHSGDVVVFKNNSSQSFWPASGPHPTHTLYPEFDPKQAIGPGQSWKFKFTKVGTWPYHNHLNPSVTGQIIVQ